MAASSAVWAGRGGVGMAPKDSEPAPVAGLEAHLREVEWWVRRRYQGHPWLDDLVAEARLGAYQGLVKCRGRRLDMASVARRAGLWAACEWLRGRSNEDGPRTRCGCSRLKRVWLVGVDGSDEGLEPVAAVEGFEADLVARVDTAGFLARSVAAGWISAMEAEIVRRVTMEGETPQAVGASLGLSRRRCGLLKRRALAVLRAHWEEEK